MAGFDSLSVEIQLELLRHMDRDTLAVISRTNKRISAVASDLLWREIDFVALRDQGTTGEDLLYAQGLFFLACDRLMNSDPRRWKELASRVKSLRMVKVPSFAIPKNGPADDPYQWSFLINASADGPSIYHVMSEFEKLETLHFYIRESLDLMGDPEAAVPMMEGKLPNLKTVEVGGNVSGEMMSAILSRPEKLEHLSCINLQDGTAGQEYHSHPVIFLRNVASNFKSLRQLHLSMLSQYADDMDDEDQSLSWEWDTEDDDDVFKDWSYALEQTCSTLEELTLESSYLRSEEGSVEINFNEEDEEDENGEKRFKGLASSQRFREAMLPLLARLEWPKLKKLTFVGIHISPRTLRESGVLDKLSTDTDIHVLPGQSTKYEYDVTPLSVSPPNGTFQDNIVDDRLSKLGYLLDKALRESA